MKLILLFWFPPCYSEFEFLCSPGWLALRPLSEILFVYAWCPFLYYCFWCWYNACCSIIILTIISLTASAYYSGNGKSISDSLLPLFFWDNGKCITCGISYPNQISAVLVNFSLIYLLGKRGQVTAKVRGRVKYWLWLRALLLSCLLLQ